MGLSIIEVLDAVEDVIGPDILVYHTTMNIKEARNKAYIPWHQDDGYFHLDPPEHVTAWVAPPMHPKQPAACE